MTQRDELVDAVIKAWKDEGPMPAYHRLAKANLLRVWPSLGYAVMRLADRETALRDGRIGEGMAPPPRAAVPPVPPRPTRPGSGDSTGSRARVGGTDPNALSAPLTGPGWTQPSLLEEGQ